MQFRFFIVLLAVLFTSVFLFSTEPVVAKSSTDSTKTEKKSSKSSKSKTSKDKNSKTKKSSSKTTKKAVAGKVNINKANAETLAQLTGIGPKTAKNILAYRKKNGKFKSANDLLNVKGIGEKSLKKMKGQLKF